jgi:adenosylcobinamide-GDP ribazoletransferase
MRSILTELFMAVQFLTRIPVPSKARNRFDENAFVNSVRWYPYVGLLIGVILYGMSKLFFLWFPASIASVLLVAASILLTGGLHADGLMDTADGLLSGRDREQKLSIMKDSRVGAMGVIAFVCLFAVKWASIETVGQHSPLVLLIFPSFGRVAMVWAIARHQPARQEGMGVLLAGKVNLSQLVTATIVLLLPVVLWQVNGLILILTGSALYWWMARVMSRALGGLTGDTYGALCELTEAAVLLSAVALFS